MLYQDLQEGRISEEDYNRDLARALHLRLDPGHQAYYESFTWMQWLAYVSQYTDKAHAFRVFREFGEVWNTDRFVRVYLQLYRDLREET